MTTLAITELGTTLEIIEQVTTLTISEGASTAYVDAAQAAAQAYALALVDDLSGVTDPATARTNLGLGTAAIEDTGAFDSAGAAASALVSAQAYTDAHAALTSNPHSVTAVQLGALTDAPSDGTQYGRQNGAWSAISGGGGGASDVGDLSTDAGNATEFLRVAAGGAALEYRTPVQVLADIGAAPTSSPTFTGTVTIGGDTITLNQATTISGPSSTAALDLLGVATVDTINNALGIGAAPSSDYTLDVVQSGGLVTARILQSYASSVDRQILVVEGKTTSGDPGAGFGAGIVLRLTGNSGSNNVEINSLYDAAYPLGKLVVQNANNILYTAGYSSAGARFGVGTTSPSAPMHLVQKSGGAVDIVSLFEFDKTSAAVDDESAHNEYWLTTASQDQRQTANVTWSWPEAADTTRKGKYAISVFDTVERDGISIESDGSQANTTIHGKLTASDTLNIPTATPASASATGTAGDIAWDANYFYIWVADNTVQRVAHATW